MQEFPVALGGVLAFAIGASVGSFVGVVAHRLPREISVVRPASFCPNCERPIPWWLNIPILSYIGLRGRCLICRGPIPFRHFLTELTLAVAALYLYLTFPLGDAIARFVLCATLFASSLIDYDWRIIPDRISLPGIPIGILCATFLMPEVGWKSSLIGFAIGGVFLFGVGEVYRLVRGQEGMGMGDVKLLAMVGAFLGWPAVLFTIFCGSLLGSIGGLVVALSGGARPAPAAAGSVALSTIETESTIHPAPEPLPDEAGESDRVSIMQTTIPFGPFLSFAAGVYALFQPQLTAWYLSR